MEESCTFCQIVGGQRASDLVYQNPSLIVIKNIRPHAPVHLLVIPRKHIRSINDLDESDRPLISEMIFTGRRMAEEKGIAQSGYKLLFNVERGGGQVIFHVHLHIIGGWE